VFDRGSSARRSESARDDNTRRDLGQGAFTDQRKREKLLLHGVDTSTVGDGQSAKFSEAIQTTGLGGASRRECRHFFAPYESAATIDRGSRNSAAMSAASKSARIGNMGKPLIEVMLPRLARPLYRHLEQFQTGKLDEKQFTNRFEKVLNEQHAWLSRRGIAAGRGAVAIHAAVLVLSLPGLRAEAGDLRVPLEILEARAVREAANDVASTYGMPVQKAADAIATLVAKYAT
jgi:hypothetical protein